MTLGDITKKGNRPQTENILHVVSKFFAGPSCFQDEKNGSNFGVVTT